MIDPKLLIDLHKTNTRLGPGGDEQTRLALQLAGLNRSAPDLSVADLGCGTGASTLLLAQVLGAQITAVDLFPEFLEALERRAEQGGMRDRIVTAATSMAALPFAEDSLDLIWAEGSIYNLGFEAGLGAWRPFLSPGGVLAVSELTWLTAERPAELEEHWRERYPEVDTAAAKIGVLERNGFTPIGYFPLPELCWLENYYRPLEARFSSFLEEHDHSAAAEACVAEERLEIAVYQKHRAHVSYGFYIARKRSSVAI